MYFSKENTDVLHQIITGLNSLENESEQDGYLHEYVEDVGLFLQTLKSVNKKKLPRETRTSTKNKRQAVQPPAYQEDAVRQIFQEHDTESLLDSYSLAEFKAMYFAIYQKYPLAKSKKEDILKVIKNHFSTMDRAASFTRLPSGS